MRRFSDQLCQRTPHDDSRVSLITTPLFTSLALVVFLLRVAARMTTGLRDSWRLDDWAILPAVLCLFPLAALCITLARNGLGRDMWFIADPEQITRLLHLYYWGELVYLVMIPTCKISVLVFYLQVFPERAYRWCSITLIAGNVLYMVGFVTATALQCTPVDGAWRGWDGTYAASCRNVNALAWAAAAVSIALDLCMLVLPMPALWRLKMGVRKRLQVMFMFGLGVL
jgi:hypothetical protein